MQELRETLSALVLIVELAGIAVIVGGFAIATVRYAVRFAASGNNGLYTFYRRSLARSIILGLEFLIAADIIRTVMVDETLESIINLGLIILIRIVLGFTLHLEDEGRWPWQPGKE